MLLQNANNGNHNNGQVNGQEHGALPTFTWRQPLVFLARHGTPDWNMPGIRYDIPPGPPLVAQGEEEAAKLGSFLRTQGVQLIYASPLVRARRTAEIAAEVAGVGVEVVDAVAEYRREENDADVFARVNPFFLRAWAEAAQYGPVAIVSHGGPVRVMLEKLGGLPDVLWHYRKQFDHQNPLPPAAAWRVSSATQPGQWQLELQFTPQAHIPYQPTTVNV
jgi:probable phosphoglycerate mutase